MRRALSVAPTYGHVEHNADAYLHPLQLRPLARQHGRYWSFHSIPTTVALPNNRYAKSLKPFTSHTNETDFRELLREYASYGVPRPSGYADVFHERYKSPRVHYSINALLAPVMAGGWQAAIKNGAFKGVYYRYDMRSAYLWAATLGLPDTSTYRRSLNSGISNKYDGVYRVKLVKPSPNAPFPFDRAHECLASNHEIETYGLRIGEVIDGVIWKKQTSTNKLIDTIRLVSTWKQAGRCYWGRWAQLQKVECVCRGKKWSIPNMALNIPWAHIIVSRVKMRLWEYSRNALHVFVDSVITPERLPVGMALGDWRLEKTYDDGVFIRAPGQYGSLNESRLEKMAGIPKDSPARNTPVAAGV